MANNSNGKKPPMVSSLSMIFKKSTAPTEEVAEAKKEHRRNLRTLVDTYMSSVEAGEADGIRNAKDLVDVIKMDLLLLGEATERQDNASQLDEVRVQKVSQAIDLDNPAIQNLIGDVLKAMNTTNDEADTSIMIKSDLPNNTDETDIDDRDSVDIQSMLKGFNDDNDGIVDIDTGIEDGP